MCKTSKIKHHRYTKIMLVALGRPKLPVFVQQYRDWKLQNKYNEYKKYNQHVHCTQRVHVPVHCANAGTCQYRGRRWWCRWGSPSNRRPSFVVHCQTIEKQLRKVLDCPVMYVNRKVKTYQKNCSYTTPEVLRAFG